MPIDRRVEIVNEHMRPENAQEFADCIATFGGKLATVLTHPVTITRALVRTGWLRVTRRRGDGR